MNKTISVFTTLNKIDVSDKTEKKGNQLDRDWEIFSLLFFKF